MLVMFSLVLSPPPQLSLFAVQVTLRSLCEDDHMMYATVYVTHANSSKKFFVASYPWERYLRYLGNETGIIMQQ